MNDDRPYYSTRIEWDEYKLFLDELNKTTGMSFALPTPVQWQYAKQCLNGLDVLGEGMKVGIYNRRTGRLNAKVQEINPALLCSIGNGHEELKLFLASTDVSEKPPKMNLSKLRTCAGRILTDSKYEDRSTTTENEFEDSTDNEGLPFF